MGYEKNYQKIKNVGYYLIIVPTLDIKIYLVSNKMTLIVYAKTKEKSIPYTKKYKVLSSLCRSEKK